MFLIDRHLYIYIFSDMARSSGMQEDVPYDPEQGLELMDEHRADDDDEEFHHRDDDDDDGAEIGKLCLGIMNQHLFSRETAMF